MTKHGLYYQVAKALEAFGRIEGGVLAMKGLIEKELGDAYLGEEFDASLKHGLDELAGHLENALRGLGEFETQPKIEKDDE